MTSLQREIRRTRWTLLIALMSVPTAFAAETRDHYFAHDTLEDKHGVIAPWYTAQNGQFDFHVRVSGETLRRYPWVGTDRAAGIAPEYAYNNTWQIDHDGTITVPHEITNWRNGARGQGAARVLHAWVEYYRYTGDPAALAHLEVVADTVIRFSQTDASHPWPNFLVSVPNAGKPYGQVSADGWMQLDIVGEMGVALIRAYQLTGQKRFLDTVKHWADVFVARRNRTPGTPPWPRYANPEKVPWGKSKYGNLQTGGIVYQLTMFDELIRLGYTGNNGDLIEARDAGRRHLRDVLLPAWVENDTWGRNYWDWQDQVQAQTTTDWAVRYFMDNPDYFPNWKNDVRNIMGVFLNHTSVDPASETEAYSGAWAVPESSGCCKTSLAWASMEFAAIFARYGVEADSEWGREMARRMLILSTYNIHETGLVEDNIHGGVRAADTWINGAVHSALKWILRTMSWLPEVTGPPRENHLMRSSAVVSSVVYEPGSIRYSTFDAPAKTVDVLRLAFVPSSITADGKPLRKRSDLDANGYTVKLLPSRDAIVSIRHDGATQIEVNGKDPQKLADDAALAFDGDWLQSARPEAVGGGLRSTGQQGAAMEFRFTGNQVRLIGSVGPRGGKADVYVDGTKQLVGIDFWNPRELHRQILYYRNGLSQGQHTLRIVVREDSNLLSKGKEVTVDAVQYSAEQAAFDFGSGGGPTDTQRLIFGYAGREDFLDSKGHAWRPATEFVVRTGEATDSVAQTWWTMKRAPFAKGTQDPDLYAYGVHANDFTVNVTVGPGEYYVRLKFWENIPLQRRVMDIFINDHKVVERFNVLATAARVPRTMDYGRHETTVDLVFNGIKPKNGIIEVRLVGERRGGFPTEAILQALEVGQGDGGTGNTPEGSIREMPP
jgi:hypothetical protein